MAYDDSKFTTLGHLTTLAKTTKSELDAVKEIAESVSHPEYLITEDEISGEYAAVYHLTKNGEETGVPINVPKGAILSGGEVITKDNGIYLKLTFDGDEEDVLISVDELAQKPVSASGKDDAVKVTVDSATQGISAEIQDGKVTKEMLEAYIQEALDEIDNKVTKEDGKGLSTNDFTNAYKEKLESAETGSSEKLTVNVMENTFTYDGSEEQTINVLPMNNTLDQVIQNLPQTYSPDYYASRMILMPYNVSYDSHSNDGVMSYDNFHVESWCYVDIDELLDNKWYMPKPEIYYVQLVATNFDNSDKMCSVDVNGVSSDMLNQLVIPVPDDASFDAYYAANVRCILEGSGFLKFKADSVPTMDLDVKIMVIDTHRLMLG